MSFFGQTTALPKEKKSLGSINSDDFNSSQQAQPVTYFAGRRYIAGQFISPGYNEVIKDVKATTGKGESSTVAHVYFCDFGLVMSLAGRAPVDAIFKIIVESEIVWKNDAGLYRDTDLFEDITVDKYGQARIYWGTETQGIDPLVFTTRGQIPIDPNFDKRDKKTWPKNTATGGQTTNNGDASGDTNPLSGHYDQHPAYRGQCYMVFKKWKLGRDRGAIPNIQVELQRGVPWFAGSALDRTATGFNSDARGVNPIGVLYEALTDPRFGRARPDSALMLSKFETVATALASLRISPRATELEDFRTFVAKLLEYFDGWVRMNAGQVEVGYFGHGAINLGALPIVLDDDLDGEPELKPLTYKDASTQFFVVYSDRLHNYQERPGQKFDNPAMRRIIGEPRPVWLQRPWLTDPDIAKRVTTEEGKIRSLPAQSGELPLKREWLDAHAVLPGDRFMWNSASRGLSIALRINKIRRAKDSSGQATLTIENERSIWPSIYIPAAVDTPGDFHHEPPAIVNQQVMELTYLLKTANALQVAVFAQRSSVEVIGFRVWISADGGATYDLVSDSRAFAAYGELNDNYAFNSTTPDTTVGAAVRLYGVDLEKVAAQSDQARDSDTLLMFCGWEVFSVGNVVAQGDGLFTVYGARFQYGTFPFNAFLNPAHAGGTACWFIFRSELVRMAHADFVPGSTVRFKLQPYTQVQDYDLGSVTPIVYSFALPGDPPSVSITPASQSFTGTLNVNAAGPPLGTLRYTLDGSEPNQQSATWDPDATTIAITQSCIFTVRAFFLDGSYSPKAVATYTLVSSGAGLPAAAPVQFFFSGRKGYTAGTMSLGGATPSHTIRYSKNGAAYVTYTVPFSIALTDTGDTVEAYETATGFSDSVHTFFNNKKQSGSGFPVGSGGGGGGIDHNPY